MIQKTGSNKVFMATVKAVSPLDGNENFSRIPVGGAGWHCGRKRGAKFLCRIIPDGNDIARMNASVGRLGAAFFAMLLTTAAAMGTEDMRVTESRDGQYINETAITFLKDGSMIALTRRDNGPGGARRRRPRQYRGGR